MNEKQRVGIKIMREEERRNANSKIINRRIELREFMIDKAK